MSQCTWTHMNRRAFPFNGICWMTKKRDVFLNITLKNDDMNDMVSFCLVKSKSAALLYKPHFGAVYTFPSVSSDMWVAISQSMSIAIVFDGGRAVCVILIVSSTLFKEHRIHKKYHRKTHTRINLTHTSKPRVHTHCIHNRKIVWSHAAPLVHM